MTIKPRREEVGDGVFLGTSTPSGHPMRYLCLLLGLSASFAVHFSATRAHADVCKLSKTFQLTGDLAGKRPGKKATDISGIACMDRPGSMFYRCLVVNDENQTAQFVTVQGGSIAVGSEVQLIGASPDPGTLGQPPNVSCPGGNGAFGEFDGEGVAYSEPYFFVVGSHGCSRKRGLFRLSQFLLARIEVDKQGKIVDRTATYRLSDALRQAKKVGGFFGKDLNSANGLNVEGVVVVDKKLVVGLRGPSLQDNAYLVTASLASLFSPGSAIEKTDDVELIPLPFGKPLGVRDLAPLPDGRVLVLAGPAQEQKLDFEFFVAEPRPGGALTQLCTVAQVRESETVGKAEAVTVLEVTGGSMRVLVFFDGLTNGGPREYLVPVR